MVPSTVDTALDDEERIAGCLEHLVVMGEGPVPLQGEADPFRVEARVVEGVDDDDGERHVEKGVDGDRHDP
jgi:hypothetical protein